MKPETLIAVRKQLPPAYTTGHLFEREHATSDNGGKYAITHTLKNHYHIFHIKKIGLFVEAVCCSVPLNVMVWLNGHWPTYYENVKMYL